jgi:hypothetical protein
MLRSKRDVVADKEEHVEEHEHEHEQETRDQDEDNDQLEEDDQSSFSNHSTFIIFPLSSPLAHFTTLSI